MRNPRLTNYLRMYRKHSGLSTDAIAGLVGLRRRDSVTRHERDVRIPDLQTAFAYEAILSVGVDELFSGLRDQVITRVQARARKALERLEAFPTSAARGRIKRALKRIAVVHTP